MPKYLEEGFKPIKHEPPTTFVRKIKFYGRMLLDLQILTIYADIKDELPQFKGKILDIGCGQSPYRYLLNKSETEYKGIDVVEASSFDYINNDITLFDGEHIPFPDNTFEAVICTEVLEHVFNYQTLVDEMYRVCKPNAQLIITIPFSARYHYIPYDYFRYTPSALEKIFSKFSKVEITPRGTDVLSICAKIIVLFFRNIIPNNFVKMICLPFWIFMLPILGITVFIAHISRILSLGSNLDPLGYTIKVIK
jgi:ubiquinone/menaquinone biosynthesis C-methylase UbiE